MHIHEKLLSRAMNKASSSGCRYRISAIGLNSKGEIVGSSTNKPRFSKLGGSIHAEMALMKSAPPSLNTIILCRVGKKGILRPIDPCKVCATKAEELGVKIIPIRP